jgi:uncharacterized protein
MEKKIPMRQCTGCGLMKEKKQLIRIVKTAEGDITLDRSGRMNGRGAYICPDHECLEKVIKNKGLNRAFKMPVSTEVIEKLRQEIIEIEG